MLSIQCKKQTRFSWVINCITWICKVENRLVEIVERDRERFVSEEKTYSARREIVEREGERLLVKEREVGCQKCEFTYEQLLKSPVILESYITESSGICVFYIYKS